jgi:hypothetical protein
MLVLLCAIPYTGWLAGYFVSARMLWRSPWLFPIGLVGIVLLTNLTNVITSKTANMSRYRSRIRNVTFLGCIAVCIIVTGYYYQYHPIQDSRDNNLHEYKVWLEEQAALGE